MTRCILVSMAVLCAAGTAMGEAIPLKIMSFNLRYGTARDGENSWPHRRDILVETIERYSPDVLGTQECLDFQAEYIAEKLPEYRWIGIGREKNGQGEMTAVLYKKKEYIPVASGHFWLSEAPDVPGSMSWDTSITRMVTWVRFYLPASGTFFHFFNTHFDHRGELAREKSGELLGQRATDFPEGYPVVVTGDFNAVEAGSKPWENMISAGLKDAWQNAEKKEGPAATFSEFKAPDPENTTRIDWILYRGGLIPQRVLTIGDNQDGRYPSDHLPVLAEFLLER